ncbi:fungal-specific transcription factor domain-containing protein [Xylariaceae sp. FL0662B]|nr:fungal-specific transcription factor domain-containing protein [Xylariaceae sp. FL0662B]
MTRSAKMQPSKRRSRDGEAARRRFTCTHEGCGRSFSRSEHLHRHQKNHTDGDATCPRCRAHFKRQDLLDRHMNRHRQKDEAAGGDGNGILNTRKRMWKDHDGKIVHKRPTDSHATSQTSFPIQADEPISPPGSSRNSDVPNDSNPAHTPFTNEHSVLPAYSLSTLQYDSQELAGDWTSPIIESRPRSLMPADDINYDEIFQPDTASSFNMPYTTQLNYDWLFSLNDSLPTPVSQPSCGPAGALPSYSFSLQHPTPMNPESDTSPMASRARDFTSDAVEDLSSPSMGRSRTYRSIRNSTSPAVLEKIATSHTPPFRSNVTDSANETPELEFERPLAALWQTENLPVIDELSYTRILETIRDSRPLTPDGSLLDINHPSLSATSLQTYCNLYFTEFNTTYPLIHRATFKPGLKEPLLILSMILLGATYADKDAHRLAVCIHDVIRPVIFSHASFNPKPDLWVLQTILLVECFGKSRAGQKQHDMSHLFHGMLINLIRRSDCQTVRPSRPGQVDKGDPDADPDDWTKWVAAEEKKRLALLCFMWDTQHAVLFCQSLCMSAFELRLPLPCNQALWEASTTADWARISRSTAPEPMYLPALKSYIVQEAHQIPHLNGLSRVMLFHGLMSIFWDMQRRDQTSLGVIPSEGGRWQDRLGEAYEAWKTDFDRYYLRLSELTLGEIRKGVLTEEAKIQLDVWRMAYVMVYYAANVLLHSEFLDIQIYAGARNILGRPVQPADFRRSERVVKRWATSRVVQHGEGIDGSARAAKAAWHAAKLLDLSDRLVDFNSTGLFHVPWCLYLATLTIWAFHHAGMKSLGFAHEEDSELVWDAQAEMGAVVRSMVNAGPKGLLEMQGLKRTGGLVWVVAEALSKVRWGIVHGATVVLRNLIPMRLIGQFQDV